jgi:tRNA 2-thiouridine synthesizing protein A
MKRTAHERILDLRGLICPQPVLRTENALEALPPGAFLTILTTDPLAGLDIPHLARRDGHVLLSQEEQENVLTIRLQKRGATKVRVATGIGCKKKLMPLT